jgi:hypothetical protein
VMSGSSDADSEVARGRRGSRAWRRSVAATLTGPARLSTPITRLRKAAINNSSERPLVTGLPTQAAGMMQEGDSDCGPDGHAEHGPLSIRTVRSSYDHLCSTRPSPTASTASGWVGMVLTRSVLTPTSPASTAGPSPVTVGPSHAASLLTATRPPTMRRRPR